MSANKSFLPLVFVEPGSAGKSAVFVFELLGLFEKCIIILELGFEDDAEEFWFFEDGLLFFNKALVDNLLSTLSKT